MEIKKEVIKQLIDTVYEGVNTSKYYGPIIYIPDPLNVKKKTLNVHALQLAMQLSIVVVGEYAKSITIQNQS